MTTPTPKDAACTLMAFVVTILAVLMVGAICVAAALKMVADHQYNQASAMTVSYVVLSLGAGEAAKQIKRLLTVALPGRSNAA